MAAQQTSRSRPPLSSPCCWTWSYEVCLLAVSAALLVGSLHLEWHRQDVGATVAKARFLLNNTARSGLSSLFFNRIPKAGSTTIMRLLQVLSTANNFSYAGDNKVSSHSRKVLGESVLTEPWERELYAVSVNRAEDTVFFKHVAFMDMTEGGYDDHHPQAVARQNPIYMTFVRDPVERFVSWYYYSRQTMYAAQQFSKHNTYVYNPKMYKLTVEECFLLERPECRIKPGGKVYDGDLKEHKSQMIFLCGNHEFCNILNDDRAFRKAVENLEKFYAVVGVVEEWEKSLKVLEAYIPRYFRGIVHLYSMNPLLRVINKTQFKPPSDEEVRALMRQSMSNEVRFYNYCRQRLHKQYLALI